MKITKKNKSKKWKILIAHKQKQIHSMIIQFLNDFIFQGIGLVFLNAFSDKEVKIVLNENPDISVLILDIMLEKENYGFEIVKYIREIINNDILKIIMLADHLEIENAKYFFVMYNIDMYCSTDDLNKIFFLITSCLRSYERSNSNYQLRKQLKDEISNHQNLIEYLNKFNNQLENLVYNNEPNIQKSKSSLKEIIDYSIQLTKKLDDNNKLKSRFIANLSHEIRTSLNGILGMLRLTLDSELKKIQREYISIAKLSGDHLLFLINDILDFSKLESDNLHITNELFNLKDIIESAIAPLKIAALENGLELIYEIDPDIPEQLIGPKNRLLQIFINLIKNAIKFSECSEIIIKANLNDQNLSVSDNSDEHIEILFSVIDKGIGIDQNMIKSIFDPFFQGHFELSESKGGIGLGLSICKQLVEMMEGKIWVESEPEKGSSFFFILPFNKNIGFEDKKENHKYPFQKPDFEPILKERPKILLVEDQFVNQDICVSILERNGYEVTVVMNGIEALEAFEKETFDLILMDIKMPEMDGFTAAKLIRKRETNGQHIPIIAVTVMADQEDKDACLKAGMDNHIARPVDPHDLLMAVKQYIKTPDNKKLKSPSSELRLISSKRFELDKLKNIYNNDMAIISEKINQFKEKGQIIISQIEKSFFDGNELQLGKYVHKLMNISSDAGAQKISDNAFRCKLAMRKKDNEKVQQMILKIKEEYDFFVIEVLDENI